MRKVLLVTIWFIAFWGSCFAGLSEVGVYTGYAGGHIHNPQDHYKVYPAFLRVGFCLNDLLCISPCFPGRVQFNLEPFMNGVFHPETGEEVGIGLMFMYTHPMISSLWGYLEGGAGPMYLSVKTIEQESRGFNFLDQFGLGVRGQIGEKVLLSTGYRWRHISHAGLRDSRNSGINSHALIVGLSRMY